MIYILHPGNLIEQLAPYPDNTFDAIVTDCPYGLGDEPDPVETLSAWIANGFHEIKGKGFMGKDWDAFVPQPIHWRAIFRVLKPGGHVLAFFGTRTYDWGVMAMRFAGFEIRNQLQWIFGSGFPKSLNISKEIDRQAGAERDVIATKETGADKPADSDTTMRISKDTYVDELGKTVFNITAAKTDAAKTDAAKQWDGWGTNLKPAFEPIVLARKPISENTIAENVLKWGTGGIYIEGCRIDHDEPEKTTVRKGFQGVRDENKMRGTFQNGTLATPDPDGRFPANIIFDECAAELLDLQSGELTTGSQQPVQRMNVEGWAGPMPAETTYTCEKNTEGASRFFYVAKPSQFERSAGLGDTFIERFINDGRKKDNDTAFQRGKTPKKNWHPTVKPIQLCRYLIKMITPPGGKVLDPFMGSGTTGCACAVDDVEFYGIDLDPECIPLATARIEYWKHEGEKERAKPVQGSLF